MKRLKSILAIVLICHGINLYPQQSFELIFGIVGRESLRYSFEDNDCFISVGGRETEARFERQLPLILKTDLFGEIISEKILIKQDTSFSFGFGFVKPNGNYFLFGTLSDSITYEFDYNVTYICEMTPALDIVNEKMHTIPFPPHHSNHTLSNFLITPDNNIIVEGRIDTSLYGFNDILYLAKYDKEGNQISFNPFLEWHDLEVGSDLIFNDDSTGFYLFGVLSYTVGFLKHWIAFDLDFNIIENGQIENELSYFHAPLSVRRLSNGSMIMANQSSEINGNAVQDLEMRIIDTDLNLLKDTILYHDEYVNIPDHRGMGFMDENNIWVATYENNPTFLTGTEVFRFFIFDSNLRLKGVKVYGGSTRYWFFDLLVTSDGGCLLTGVVPEYEGSYSDDSYLIKVIPSDILTNAEETPFENDMDVYVYPNPFNNGLRTETMRTGLTFILFDQIGKPVISELINDIPHDVFNTEFLSSGFYIYQIFDNLRIIQNGKLIKE